MSNWMTTGIAGLIVLMGGMIVYHLITVADLQSEKHLLKLEKADLEAENASLKNNLEEALRANRNWSHASDRMEKSLKAAIDQALKSLEREQWALVEAEAWRRGIEQAMQRDMTETEEKKVPDDEARRAFLADLDRPL